MAAVQPTWCDTFQMPAAFTAEVISHSHTLAESALKAQTHRQAGVLEVWVIDHHTRTVEVWATGGVTTLGATQSLTSPLLPGFSLGIQILLDG